LCAFLSVEARLLRSVCLGSSLTLFFAASAIKARCRLPPYRLRNTQNQINNCTSVIRWSRNGISNRARFLVPASMSITSLCSHARSQPVAQNAESSPAIFPAMQVAESAALLLAIANIEFNLARRHTTARRIVVHPLPNLLIRRLRSNCTSA